MISYTSTEHTNLEVKSPMTEQKSSRESFEPKASRPRLPAGYDMLVDKSRGGLLQWSWAVERLTNAHNYWMTTVRSDGRPHVVPVWGIWRDNGFMFSTDRQTVKARNLAANPNCVVCPEQADEAVIVEGRAEEVTDLELLKRYVEIYNAKYSWNQEVTQGPFYRVRPLRVLAFVEQPIGSATRWTFD